MDEPDPRVWRELSVEKLSDLAKLARLELGKEDLEVMAFQIAKIIVYVSSLKQVNTEGVEPLAHALDVANVFRADEPASSLSPDQALANAPRRQQDYFGVPAVLD